ncbi:hypothetical protein [Rhodococcus sp. ARC_M6]|uniref:hypothetical protein n=1 Tax=Rhodococcus sp. ARC_M6 TaxID=2928852 RepID=UPI001FB27593|nr:hypothetical protein [Rhodococcus sp. ARC_M6]MCJ0907028.1 hypothetical protein [Rhodococcus sp. ARC_M6]
MIFVGLARSTFLGQDPDEGFYTVSYGEGVVKDSAYSLVLRDDQKKAQDFADSYNYGESPANRMKITDKIQVSVAFSPRNERQPAGVVSAVGGDKGTKLEASPQAKKIGGLTNDPYWTLGVDTEHNLPFSP